jgi:hypothetical protein
MRAVYASARQQGMTDEMLAAIPHYQNSPLFTPREKAAFHFAEPEILELGWRIAIFVGYGRLV